MFGVDLVFPETPLEKIQTLFLEQEGVLDQIVSGDVIRFAYFLVLVVIVQFR